MRIISEVTKTHRAMEEFTPMQVKNEPMLFNCDFDHALDLGSDLTRNFLGLLPASWKDQPLVIDSRVHMLMPGWYPCIPGWHHDDVPRTRLDGQPNYGPGQFRSEHMIALVGGEICATEFALGDAEFNEPALGRVIYADWHPEVEKRCNNGILTRWSCPSNTLVMFNDRTWHRGTAATGNGWRWFIRASRYFGTDGQPVERGNPRTNELRKNAQVYMSAENAGW